VNFRNVFIKLDMYEPQRSCGSNDHNNDDDETMGETQTSSTALPARLVWQLAITNIGEDPQQFC
jgi:hypothetical protein